MAYWKANATVASVAMVAILATVATVATVFERDLIWAHPDRLGPRPAP
jgi:hypothetical protein